MKNNKIEAMAALRMLLSDDNLVTVREIKSNSGLLDAADKLIEEGYATAKSVVLELSLSDSIETDYKKKINAWNNSEKSKPLFVAIEGMGAFLVADCGALADCMLAKSTWFLHNSIPKRMQNKVVVITGGAQGFGAGIAREFFNEGANVVIADLNEITGITLSEELNNLDFPNKAFFVKTDVSDYNSVENLVNETVIHFGGLDAMISNAGILRAGGLDEMTPESFELMTKVNYAGYFNCAKAASKVMKCQAKFTDDKYFDIIQINSKSGLKGSNKNFAYAGGKFGGIGLTQSFALELMPDRIKVNSICPGNFFDGPLWSDPEKGLFVQYLNAGKVPGAKSLEDVKSFYEQQVPAGRGCGTLDVAKAAFYAIEQEYETGQAIPVTGGQIMLH